MTTEEIRKELTEAFMADPDAATLFGFAAGVDKFDDRFSRVGLMSILFYVVAYVIALKERSLDLWKKDIELTADSTRYGTWQWWVKTCKEFQNGDTTTVINGKVTYYPIDESNRIVTIATAKPSPVVNGTGLSLYVAKGTQGSYQPLSQAELASFEAYIAQVKPLGMPVLVFSGAGAQLGVDISVTYNSTAPVSDLEQAVKDAIEAYITGVAFGGMVYKSRIASAVNAVEGVLDCVINSWSADGAGIVDEYFEPQYGYAVLDTSTTNITLTYTNSYANN